MDVEVLTALGVANLAGGAAILAVLALRGPVRRRFGARAAYRLWAAVPAAAVATFLPGRVVILYVREAASPPFQAPSVPAWDGPGTALAVWIGGAAVSLAWLVLRHRRARRALGPLRRVAAGPPGIYRAERAEGPMVLGLVRPRIVVPGDFEDRFAPDERRMILAHEAEHLAGGHLVVNALVSLAACVNWFNPLVHLAIVPFRTDQELACDAAVLERRPRQRRLYAQALLKAQPAASPLGCQWPAASSSLLKERIAMVAKSEPGRSRRFAGSLLAGALAAGAGAAAWGAQPPSVEVRPIYPPVLSTAAAAPVAAAAPAAAEPAAPREVDLVRAQASRDAAPPPPETARARPAPAPAPRPAPRAEALPAIPPLPPAPALREAWSPEERAEFQARMKDFRAEMEAWRRRHEAWLRENPPRWSSADAAALRERYRSLGQAQSEASREARRTARRARIEAQLAALEAQSRALRAPLEALDRDPAGARSAPVPPQPPAPPAPPRQ